MITAIRTAMRRSASWLLVLMVQVATAALKATFGWRGWNHGQGGQRRKRLARKKRPNDKPTFQLRAGYVR